MNNWHRKIYTLDPPTPRAGPPGQVSYTDLFNPTAGASNQFWLEPAVYTGPATSVAFLPVDSNTLCYRLQFDDDDMNEVWRGLTFFPRGTNALSTVLDNKSNPQPDPNTERLQAQTTIQIKGMLAVITLYDDSNAVPPPTGFHVQVQATGGGGGGGWGGGHN